MNVTCTGCPAKYAVPDEKVRGKKVRITCKHCGTNIVVDGNALGADPNLAPKAAAESAPRPATASAPDLTSAAPAPAVARKAALAAAPEPTFVVGFLDDRQESHTLTQVVEMYRSGQIDDDVLVWKDGMADWLSPFDVPEVATAMLEHGVTRNSANADSASAGNEAQISIAHPPVEDAELAAAAAPAPLIATAPVLAAALSPNAFGRSKSEAQPAVPPVAQPLEGSATIAPATATPAPKAAAARRSEPRGGAVDLFGSLAEAGGESDSSLDFGSASESGDEPGHKLTGARNESSVLFSLDALTRPEAKATQKQRAREKEDEASAALFGDSAPNSLMNVGGGGLAALAAPDFTKPISANVEPLHATGAAEVHDTTPPNQKKGGWVLLLGSLFGIAAIAGGAFWMMKKQAVGAAPAPSAEVTTPTATAPATTTPSTEATAPSAAPEASAMPSSSPEAAASISAAPTAVAAPAVNKPAAEKKLEARATEDTPATPTSAPTPTLAPTAPAPPEGAAFDKSAAVAALGAAAASAGSCKKPDGPTGSGKVSVTFAPSGRATATSVAGDLAGTEVGGCVARLFRSARVPPFAGDPVTVAKSFSIQ